MHEPTLHALLRNTADELASLAAKTDGLGAFGPSSVERWQSLDLISQSLSSLGIMLQTLTELVPDHAASLDAALAGVSVGSLAARLAGRTDHDGGAVEAGALDMFDA